MEKDIIFLDTNVFGKKEKYDFDHTYRNNILAVLKRYSNIEVCIPNIVINELKKHIKESIDNDQNNIKSSYIKNKLTQEFYDEILKENLEKLDEFIERNNIFVLECEKYLDISDVNKWYFNKEKPFETSKPKEFPDAMIISAIVNFLKQNEYSNAYIVSEDKGFIESISSKVECIVVNKLETILKEFFDFSIFEYKLVEDYLRHNHVLNNKNLIEFESANVNDVINIHAENATLNACEIIYDWDASESTVIINSFSVKPNFLNTFCKSPPCLFTVSTKFTVASLPRLEYQSINCFCDVKLAFIKFFAPSRVTIGIPVFCVTA